MIDILEREITKMNKNLFDVLLKDRTIKKNICWATDHYISYGAEYYPQEPVTKELIISGNNLIVQPRVVKSPEDQIKRTKQNAEVFTPSWVCNIQNNLIDEGWFGRKDVFNISTGHTWITVKEKIKFPVGKSWKQYVDAKRLEITCGEAPYLVSRYDAVTGMEIALEERTGFLDRKLRVVNENTTTEEEWLKWAVRSFESCYGYEYQGDNILIARENMLLTFIENMQHRFLHLPDDKQINKIARIISWNIWQMDGISMTVPFSEKDPVHQQTALFYDEERQGNERKEQIPCRIFDWRANCSLEFRSVLQGGKAL